MRRGRPFEPGNKFGCGRPTGSPNKKAQQAQKLFEENSPAIMALAINRSREDPQMLSLFEKHQVSFVAVTQQFNTSTSLGRLTLNILLSFAQFERELIGERTRDKMSAARRKGKFASTPITCA
jgi:hypothetical protein